MIKPVKCKTCNSPYHYQSFCPQNRKPLPRPTKPLRATKRPKQRGKHFEKWQQFRDEVAIPYLDATYGHVCSVAGCSETTVDVDHIQNRGSHPELRYELSNLQYLCRVHHRQKTDML